MKEIKHSPLPWRVIERGGAWHCDVLDSHQISVFDDRIILDDAEFIVKACNNYYELTECLSRLWVNGKCDEDICVRIENLFEKLGLELPDE